MDKYGTIGFDISYDGMHIAGDIARNRR